MARDIDAVLDWDYGLTKDSDFAATECLIEFCAQKVEDSVSNSHYHSKAGDLWFQSNVTDIDPNYLSIHPPWTSGEYSTNYVYSNTTTREREFGLEYSAIRSLSEFLADILSGHVFAFSDVFKYIPEDPLSGTKQGAANDIIQATFLGNFTGCGIDGSSNDHLTCAMNNIAKALTKSFRDNAYIAHGAANSNMTRGDAMIVVTYVRIQWVWLALPVTVLVISLICLASTISTTHRSALPIWGDNILPLLFLLPGSVERDQDGGVRGITNVAYLEKTQGIKARLEVHGEMARLEVPATTPEDHDTPNDQKTHIM